MSSFEEMNEVNKTKEDFLAIYTAADPDLFDYLQINELAALAKRLTDGDLYTLALVTFFSSGKVGRKGLDGNQLKMFYKNKRLFYGERIVNVSLGRLEIVGIIDTKSSTKRLKVHTVKRNGLYLDEMLYAINETYREFSDSIQETFEI